MLLAGCADQPGPLSEGPPGATPADGLARIAELTAQRATLAGQLALAEPGAGSGSGSEAGSEAGSGSGSEAAPGSEPGPAPGSEAGSGPGSAPESEAARGPEPGPAAGADARAAAERAGVDPEWAARVLTDQAAAAEQVRDGLLRRWAEQPDTRPAERPDPAQLRSELATVDDELVAALRVAAPARTHEDCPTSLAQAAVARAEGLDDLHRAALGRGLMSVCDGTPD
ncbi:hypothetical protein GCM10009613_29560 [Pseudonocardia kongjuensis]|uniref:Chorismate mutase n=1 Tax=Pseudonocardia kongjuensis TaxID=102227 RepID=A0ABP4IFX6_9PSEU